MSAHALLNPQWPDLKKSCRDGFGEALVELGRQDHRIVVLTADLAESTRAHLFAKAFPDRFIEMGVAEQNMMGVAAGLAAVGKIPFITSYGVFNPGRNWDQLRVSVCYSGLNVKIIGGHAGLSVGPDGATHQALEDIALTRVLPNLTVLSPCDYFEAKRMTAAMAKHVGPCYMRFGREDTEVLTRESGEFAIGRSSFLFTGSDVTIVGCGSILVHAVQAAEILARQHISVEVINAGSIKPLDEETLLTSVRKTRVVVTVEEHQVTAGLGGLVSEVLASHDPVPVERVGVPDRFGESGSAGELYEKYHLAARDVVTAVKKVLTRKQK